MILQADKYILLMFSVVYYAMCTLYFVLHADIGPEYECELRVRERGARTSYEGSRRVLFMVRLSFSVHCVTSTATASSPDSPVHLSSARQAAALSAHATAKMVPYIHSHL